MIRSYKGITPTIPSSCYVDESAQIIGDVVLGEHASVWMNAVLRGDVHSIRVGAYSNIQDCSVLHGMKEQYGVFVGEYVTVGHSVTLHGCATAQAGGEGPREHYAVCEELSGVQGRVFEREVASPGGTLANSPAFQRRVWAGSRRVLGLWQPCLTARASRGGGDPPLKWRAISRGPSGTDLAGDYGTVSADDCGTIFHREIFLRADG